MVSILIIRTSAIGDVIQTLPVLTYLRQHFPDAEIDWVVEKKIAPLLEQMDLKMNRILTIDSKRWLKARALLEMRAFYRKLREVEYDFVFDLQGNTKSACVTLAAKAKRKIGYGKASVREWPNLLATTVKYDFPLNLNVRNKYLGLVQKAMGNEAIVESPVAFHLSAEEQERLAQIVLTPSLQRPFKLMVACGSKWENKRLKESTLSALLAKIVAHCDPALFLIYASAEEKAIADRLALAHPNSSLAIGNLSLPLWQMLMREMDGVIAVDSAALHLAGTTQTPTFSVFGPTKAEVFRPLEMRHQALQGECPYGRTFVKQCPVLRTCPTGACIRDLSVDQLFEAFVLWYGKMPAKSNKQ